MWRDVVIPLVLMMISGATLSCSAQGVGAREGGGDPLSIPQKRSASVRGEGGASAVPGHATPDAAAARDGGTKTTEARRSDGGTGGGTAPVKAGEGGADGGTPAANGPPPEVARPYDPERDANADIAAALRRAQRESKGVILVFGGNWCPWCRRLAYTFQHHPEVSRRLANEFIVVPIDATGEHNADIVARYGRPTQHGVPVLVVLAPSGEMVMTQETGALERGDRHDPRAILAFLDRATAAVRAGGGGGVGARRRPNSRQ